MLEEKARHYYGTLRRSCAEAIVLAANDEFDLGLTETDAAMFKGFAGGNGCKSTCGALTGAVAVLGKLYGSREDVKAICGNFVKFYEEELGSVVCAELEEKYRTVEDRCVETVGLAARALSKYIDKLEGREEKKESTEVSADDIKRVKGLGFLQHKGTSKFNARVITRNGRVTAKETMALAQASEKYGDGHVMFTTRLTAEVSGIEYDNIPAFIADIEAAGLSTGGTGSKVRPVVSCKGTTCQYGLYDTYALSEEVHEKFYVAYHNVTLPHKFKIAFGGCPNNCVKPNLNDLGVIGARVPNYVESECKGCKKCQVEAACPIHACKMVDGKLVIDKEKCNNCGRCVGKCTFNALSDGKYGYRVYIGGRWGKNVSHGQMLDKLFTSKQEVLETIDKAILFFRSEGQTGERFADTIARVGFEKAQAAILSDELLERKNEILGIDVVGGATC